MKFNHDRCPRCKTINIGFSTTRDCAVCRLKFGCPHCGTHDKKYIEAGSCRYCGYDDDPDMSVPDPKKETV